MLNKQIIKRKYSAVVYVSCSLFYFEIARQGSKSHAPGLEITRHANFFNVKMSTTFLWTKKNVPVWEGIHLCINNFKGTYWTFEINEKLKITFLIVQHCQLIPTVWIKTHILLQSGCEKDTKVSLVWKQKKAPALKYCCRYQPWSIPIDKLMNSFFFPGKAGGLNQALYYLMSK